MNANIFFFRLFLKTRFTAFIDGILVNKFASGKFLKILLKLRKLPETRESQNEALDFCGNTKNQKQNKKQNKKAFTLTGESRLTIYANELKSGSRLPFFSEHPLMFFALELRHRRFSEPLFFIKYIFRVKSRIDSSAVPSHSIVMRSQWMQ